MTKNHLIIYSLTSLICDMQAIDILQTRIKIDMSLKSLNHKFQKVLYVNIIIHMYVECLKLDRTIL